MVLYLFLLFSIITNLVLILWFVKKGTLLKTNKPGSTKEVARFYDEQTDNFMKVYGEVIQAFRTKIISTLLDYQIESIGLKSNQVVLDAGCGVCGPSRYFATKLKLKIHAITISSLQHEKSKQFVKEAGLEQSIEIQTGDFHQLDKYYSENYFDVAYFLESFGHSIKPEAVINSVWHILKPGGTLYIKDLFVKEAVIDSMAPDIEREVQNINKAYRYNIQELNTIITFLRKRGFIISFIKTIDIPLEEFENLSISNEFQELTGINKIQNLKEYVFPVDFFEIKCYKPWNSLETGNSRYFLQNLYYMQVLNKKEEEL